MSHASFLTTNAGLTSTSNISSSVILGSGSHGGNLPVAPAPLVSATQYTFINTPLTSGVGLYSIRMSFDLQGDNTTAFTSIGVQVSTGAGVLMDMDFLVGTTFPSNAVFSFNETFNLFQSPTSVFGGVNIQFTPVFAGTAPTITSPYIAVYKIA